MQQNVFQLTGVDQIIPVNGIEGAKSYPMGPNCRAALFDSNEDVFYIKKTDANGGFGYGAGRGDYVTSSELTSQINGSQIQSQLQQIALSSANNNYETAQLINQQTGTLMAQNNTNLINAIQGFNSLQQQISSLSAHLDTCCCEIKTQMLQDKLEEANAKIIAQQNEISNAQQTQTILNTLGRFVAWAGSGSQTASVPTAG